MILYLHSSAIVKQYVAEAGSVETHRAVAESEMNGTAVVSRAEVTAALRKAVRVGAIAEPDGKAAVGSFHRSWPALVRTRITEKLIRHASDLAWAHDLRGYDSVHLASAAAWQQALGHIVTFASFDQSLWRAAQSIGLTAFPPDLPALIKLWRNR